MSTESGIEVQRSELEKMDRALVDAGLLLPGVLSHEQYTKIRYALSLARLSSFQPGAAVSGARNDRPDVVIDDSWAASLRQAVRETLKPILLGHDEPGGQLVAAREWLEQFRGEIATTRTRILQAHSEDFSVAELDAEIGRKTLVVVAGGGGGSGYIYLGAFAALDRLGIIPGLIVGASMGSVIGLFRARWRHPDFASHVRLATSLEADRVFRFASIRRRYGLPGIMRLFLQGSIGEGLNLPDGSPCRISDLEIPFVSVVAGVRPDALRSSPDEWGEVRRLGAAEKPSRIALSAQVGKQLLQMMALLNPVSVSAIGFGEDDRTMHANAVDAVGFSAAIPGILHYDVTRNDPAMHEVLGSLMEREQVVALIDGGVAANVPAREARQAVSAGRIGTRNACVLAMDSFRPRLVPSHAWLWPVMRMVEIQLREQRPYANFVLRFTGTLSPVTLLPGTESIERVMRAGQKQTERIAPALQATLQPFLWVEQQG